MDVKQVLMWVDAERWGTRRAELVALVADMQEGRSHPVPIGRYELVEMGRSADQAKHDHRRLCELAEARVLRRWRGSGRLPDCWAVNPAVDNWRRVAWNAPRRTVMSFFLAQDSGTGVALWGIAPGQTLRRGASAPEKGPNPATRPGHLSEDRRPPTQDRCPPTQFSSLSGPPPVPPYATASDASDYAFKRRNYIPSFPEGKDGQNDRSANPENRAETDKDGQYSQPDPGVTLLAAVRNAVTFPVWGAPADEIRLLARAHPDRLAELVDAAGGLSWCKGPAGVLQALHAAAEGGPPKPVVDVAARIEQLRRMIATWRQADVDQERIAELEAELATLTT